MTNVEAIKAKLLAKQYWFGDAPDARRPINPDGPEAVAVIDALVAENERLREALNRIADGTMPRPLGEPWRMDMSSSKHDRCVHGAWMYEPCTGCLDAFVSAALKDAARD